MYEEKVENEGGKNSFLNDLVLPRVGVCQKPTFKEKNKQLGPGTCLTISVS